ncbi:GNAT family N-acetyltransferase [Ruania alkalisoli]|uniref:GNAT family N-acetyltransferase n=1 Tax=Ruania alkalisoli TaxID=2779775 RepID=A0A7M1SWG3_9MICO|nr:GNAT family N-acetyltransferase [Ruania alkalisoli]QOR71909.1 GNAT family N-acetyltransferase [Ruania alkalisoli]
MVPEMAEVLAAGELTLRLLEPADHAELHAIFSDPRTHTIGSGPVRDAEETRQWLDRRRVRRTEHGVAWYAVRRPDGSMIGTAGLLIGRTEPHPEIGFEIRHQDQRRGFGTAAAMAVVAEAYRAGFEQVWATVRPWNVGSLRALDRVGFRPQRVERDEHGELICLLHRATVA